MPIKIHHGPPGSYKTSGAINDDLPLVVSSGRLLITNVRGLDDADKVKEIYNDQKMVVNDDFRIEFIDTSKEVNREHLRHFIEWAELGAFFIIDEINTIFPKTLTARQLAEYDHNGDYEQEGRPPNITEALEMHRHYNWDFVLTTPNYSKVHSVFKDVSEVAYRHVNKKTIGIGGSYWEYMHNADSLGRSKSDILSITTKRIKPYVFSLYKSTTTGKTTDTFAGKNLFTSAAFVTPLVLGGLFLLYGIYSISTSNLFDTNTSDQESVQAETKAGGFPETVIISSQDFDDSHNPNKHQINTKIASSKLVTKKPELEQEPFDNKKIYLSGFIYEYHFSIGELERSIVLKLSELKKLGYSYVALSNDLGYMTYSNNDKFVVTKRPRNNSNDYLEHESVNDNGDKGTLSLNPFVGSNNQRL